MTSSNTHVLKASSFNSSHFQTVIELATRAIEADERGQSGVAVKYYTSTIEVLLIILKGMCAGKKQSKVRCCYFEKN